MSRSCLGGVAITFWWYLGHVLVVSCSCLGGVSFMFCIFVVFWWCLLGHAALVYLIFCWSLGPKSQVVLAVSRPCFGGVSLRLCLGGFSVVFRRCLSHIWRCFERLSILVAKFASTCYITLLCFTRSSSLVSFMYTSLLASDGMFRLLCRISPFSTHDFVATMRVRVQTHIFCGVAA